MMQHMNGSNAPSGSTSPLGTPWSPAPVPEHAALDETYQDVSPFQLTRPTTSSGDSVQHRYQQPQQHQQQQQQPKKRGLFSCCFGATSPVNEDQAAAPPVSQGGHGGGLHGGPLHKSGSLQRRLSHRDSTKRPVFRKMGSLAYSDVDWFDATSKWGASADHADLLAEVDQLSRQISMAQTGPWVPDPPLRFAGDMPQRFLPYPLDLSRFCGYWARDYDRSTPPPQPIDTMLKLNFITRKVHDSIGGALVSETDKEFTMLVKPTFVPPGLNKYAETFDHINGKETSWILRRDLRTGSSTGRIYLAVDGTIVVRVEGKTLMGGTVDVIVEEFWRLEEGGEVLVCRQCCLHVPTGKTATQFLVGIKQPHPPKGWV